MKKIYLPFLITFVITAVAGIVGTAFFWQRSQSLESELSQIQEDLNNMYSSFTILNQGSQDFKDKLSSCERENEGLKLDLEEMWGPYEENEFLLQCAQEGDDVGNLKISSLQAFTDAVFPDRDESFGFSNYSISFDGEVLLTGEYQYYDESYPFHGGEVCFDVTDEASLSLLPKLIGEGPKRNFYFCFANDEEAQVAFDPIGSSGIATVVIDKLYMVAYPIEIWGSARLVRVIEKTPAV